MTILQNPKEFSMEHDTVIPIHNHFMGNIDSGKGEMRTITVGSGIGIDITWGYISEDQMSEEQNTSWTMGAYMVFNRARHIVDGDSAIIVTMLLGALDSGFVVDDVFYPPIKTGYCIDTSLRCDDGTIDEVVGFLGANPTEYGYPILTLKLIVDVSH